MRLTGYYGFPEGHRRWDLWNLLRDISQRHDKPWLCLGDFNDFLVADEKFGGGAPQRHLINGFVSHFEL